MLLYIVAAVLVLPIIYILYFSDAVRGQQGNSQPAVRSAPADCSHCMSSRQHQSTLSRHASPLDAIGAFSMQR
jgi:hypothetical protein